MRTWGDVNWGCCQLVTVWTGVDTNWGQHELEMMWSEDVVNWGQGEFGMMGSGLGMLQLGYDVNWGQRELGMMWIEHIPNWGCSELVTMATEAVVNVRQCELGLWAITQWPTALGFVGVMRGANKARKPACTAGTAHLTGDVKGWEKSAPYKTKSTNYIPA